MGADAIKLKVLEDEGELAAEVADVFAREAAEAVRERGRFTAALSGGRTPEPLYRRLAARHRDAISWDVVHFFWSDERFVAADDPESNYRMASEAMLSALPIPEANVHRIPTDGADPDECARTYEDRVRGILGASERLDWVFLGLGEDGHVASLFPGSPALEEKARLVVAVRDAPKPPPTRLTMTLPLLNAARQIHFLVTGSAKRAILYRVLSGAEEILPAQRVHPTDGTIHWWLDRAAVARDTP